MFITGEEINFSMENLTQNFEVLKHLKTYLIGSFTLAIIAAIICGLIGYFILLVLAKRKIAINNG